MAGETSMVRVVRKEILAKGADKKLLKSGGYWTRGKSMGTAAKSAG
ncbi:siderophore-interacting protein [Renibacterium salmoninarum ATCC 33209]|uniref:Siderophore-interacting protein n=1 Tax=Renibacterium salmoninarum (strain ATCC 33209 / DSM 20767 / JCM 11484 / NBRC 15589 / NCIMB 2235) TaxID=288705 RepID=A9WNW5_RENSM|nr:siderophore-interacting protein [Renibacterium salmoninarum]ABY22760.1 siderophore-interacting protein [Renibacterium salmoninarum ATCC 33209]